MKLKRRYEYQLKVPEVKDFILGKCDVPYPFDADDYFLKYFNENILDVLQSLGVNSADMDQKTAVYFAKDIIVGWIIDEGATLLAKRTDGDEEILLMKKDNDKPERCVGRRFTLNCLLDCSIGGDFGYDGNIICRMIYVVVDSTKSLMLNFV